MDLAADGLDESGHVYGFLAHSPSMQQHSKLLLPLTSANSTVTEGPTLPPRQLPPLSDFDLIEREGPTGKLRNVIRLYGPSD